MFLKELPKEGPWNRDPPMPQEWVDEQTGYECAVYRNSVGCLLGYITLPKEHPWFGLESDELGDVDVHGGVTYTRHVLNAENPNDPKWRIGFDCAHGGDYTPLLLPYSAYYWNAGIYRDFTYVKSEVERLVNQAWKAAMVQLKR